MDNLHALPNDTVLVGDYRLERVLGAGGFGITYLAEELALQRKVAIKEYFPGEFAARDGASQVRHRSSSDEKDYTWGLERFIEEAQTLARFDHTNIVRVFRYFRANNTAYMVLQFEEGLSFRQWVDSKRGIDARRRGRPGTHPGVPEQTELDRILLPLLDALELIHRHDFLHRDIAADNILIRQDGSPVLIDFGSARGEMATQTKTLSALVKPGYSPFEQYASNSRQQGPWTDIYALAATLYLAVTGSRPPDAPSRITADEFVPAARASQGAYRPHFLNAIDRALALQIEARPQSIATWRHDLFHTAPPAAANATPPEHVSPAKATRKIETMVTPQLAWKKKPAPPPIAPGAMMEHPGAPPHAPVPARPPGPGVNTRLNHAVAGGRAYVAGAARVSRDRAAVLAAKVGDVAARPKMLRLPRISVPALPSPKAAAAWVKNLAQSIHKKDPERAQRSLMKALEEEFRKPVQVDGSSSKQEDAGRNPADKRSAFWSIFKSNASSGKTPKRRVVPDRRAQNHKARQATKKSAKKKSTMRRVAWISRMAARAAVAVAFVSFLVLQKQPEGPVVAAWSSQTTPATSTRLELIKTFRGHTAPITSLAVSDDGRNIASTSKDGAGVIWNPSTGRPVRTFDAGAAKINAIDIAGDDLVLAQDDGQISLWNLKTGTPGRKFRRQNGPVLTAIFGRKPSQIFSSGDKERLRVWNAKRGSWRSLRGHKGRITALAASQDGRTLVSGGSDKTVKLWDARRWKVIKTLHSHGGAVTAVAIAPSGSVFASGSTDESIRIFPDRGNGEIKTLYGHDRAITALAFSPNGRLLASASTDHAVKLWNVETGELIHTFIGHTDAVNALAFMPDGRSLVTASADKTVRIWTSQIAGYR